MDTDNVLKPQSEIRSGGIESICGARLKKHEQFFFSFLGTDRSDATIKKRCIKITNNNIAIAPVETGNDEINKITVIEIDHENKLI